MFKFYSISPTSIAVFLFALIFFYILKKIGANKFLTFIEYAYYITIGFIVFAVAPNFIVKTSPVNNLCDSEAISLAVLDMKKIYIETSTLISTGLDPSYVYDQIACLKPNEIINMYVQLSLNEHQVSKIDKTGFSATLSPQRVIIKSFNKIKEMCVRFYTAAHQITSFVDFKFQLTICKYVLLVFLAFKIIRVKRDRMKATLPSKSMRLKS